MVALMWYLRLCISWGIRKGNVQSQANTFCSNYLGTNMYHPYFPCLNALCPVASKTHLPLHKEERGDWTVEHHVKCASRKKDLLWEVIYNNFLF
jgi:hypothetical protein